MAGWSATAGAAQGGEEISKPPAICENQASTVEVWKFQDSVMCEGERGVFGIRSWNLLTLQDQGGVPEGEVWKTRLGEVDGDGIVGGQGRRTPPATEGTETT